MLYGLLYKSGEFPAFERVQKSVADTEWPCTLESWDFQEDCVVIRGTLLGEPVAMQSEHCLTVNGYFNMAFWVEDIANKYDRCIGRGEIPCNYGLILYWMLLSDAIVRNSNSEVIHWDGEFDYPNEALCNFEDVQDRLEFTYKLEVLNILKFHLKSRAAGMPIGWNEPGLITENEFVYRAVAYRHCVCQGYLDGEGAKIEQINGSPLGEFSEIRESYKLTEAGRKYIEETLAGMLSAESVEGLN
jgi:hypothetical protein